MKGTKRSTLLALLVVGLTIAGAGPASAAAPTNDDFATATIIGSLPFSDGPTDTTESTPDATDPTDCFGTPVHSVWYTYTADFDGFVTFDTFGSDYDTILSAWTGTEGSLTLVECNDDAGGGTQSLIIVPVTSGTTYQIMVDSFGADAGNLVLNADVSEAPFTFDVTFSSTGSVTPKTGQATINGTVVCSEPGFVEIDGELGQRVGRTLIRGFFFVEVTCSEDPTTFTATVNSSNGLYVRGKATIRDVFLFGCNDAETSCDSQFLEGVVATVKLGR